jgi:hypothetical protein
MKKLLTIFWIIFLGFELKGQSSKEQLPGKVSFISSQNIYVQFRSTEGISAGDTIFILSGGNMVPLLKVTNLSSTSCVCTAFTNNEIPVSQEVLAWKKVSAIQSGKKAAPAVPKENPQKPQMADTIKKKIITPGLQQKINGSLAAYSYSSYSNTGAAGSTQMRYTLNLDARNISNSKFSFNAYTSFKHKLGSWSDVKADIFNALKIYDLSLTYEPDKTTKISLGRKINTNISNLGAMDGIQFEKSIRRFAFGAVAGFRPDFSNYGFNSNLLQYGAFVAFNSRSQEAFHQTSLGVMEQMNNSMTDRRFLYFQHTNMLVKNVYFFGTLEADLYKVKNSKPQSTFDLTGLYASLRYNISKKLSITGSYDARKNITYYETYKSLLDSILVNQPRQSIRAQVHNRIMNNITIGIQSDYRYLKTDPTPSRNFYGYLTYSNIPVINVTVTLTGTYLQSGFFQGEIFQGRLTRDLFNGKLQTQLGYQYVNYRQSESHLNTLQHIGEAGIYWQIARKLSFSLNYEGTFEKTNTYSRFYLQLRKRF